MCWNHCGIKQYPFLRKISTFIFYVLFISEQVCSALFIEIFFRSREKGRKKHLLTTYHMPYFFTNIFPSFLEINPKWIFLSMSFKWGDCLEKLRSLSKYTLLIYFLFILHFYISSDCQILNYPGLYGSYSLCSQGPHRLLEKTTMQMDNYNKICYTDRQEYVQVTLRHFSSQNLIPPLPLCHGAFQNECSLHTEGNWGVVRNPVCAGKKWWTPKLASVFNISH